MNINRVGTTSLRRVSKMVSTSSSSRAYSLPTAYGDFMSTPSSSQRKTFSLPSIVGNAFQDWFGGNRITTPLGIITGDDSISNSNSNSNSNNNIDEIAIAEDGASSLDSLMDQAIWYQKRTFQPSLIRRKRKHGFLARVRTAGGRKVLNRRRLKKRRNLCA